MPYMQVDLAVMAGAALSKQWLRVYGAPLLKLRENGVPLILLGVGLSESTYTSDARREVLDFLKRASPFAIIARDIVTYECCKGLTEHVYEGIDCGFYVSDAFVPPRLSLPPFVVCTFDKNDKHHLELSSHEIRSLHNAECVIHAHHALVSDLSPRSIWRSLVAYWRRPYIFSELPFEYLALYANARCVYSDRVHACVAALAYGRPARLFSATPRADLFAPVGCQRIREEITWPDTELLQSKKEAQRRLLSYIVNEVLRHRR